MGISEHFFVLLQKVETVLQQTFENSRRNATYQSFRIQNKIIEAAGGVLTKYIGKRVNE